MLFRSKFSDGTQIEIGAGARAHIASLTEHGASVSLDEGEVRARVVHWAGARWLFHAGPFVVTVTGTAFALSWSPEEERIDLRLENGSVEVDGPVLDQPIPLRSGKWLTVRVRQREILIRNLAGDEGTPAAPTSSSSAAVEGDPLSPSSTAVEPPAADGGLAAPTPASTTHAPARDWAASMAAGKFEDALQLRRIRCQVGIFFEIEKESRRRGSDGLRRGVVEDVLVFRKKFGLRFTLAGGDGEAEAGGGLLEDGGVGRGEMRRKAIRQLLPDDGVRRCVQIRDASGGNRSIDFEIGLAGNADLAANEPVDMRFERGRTGHCRVCHVEAEWEQDFVFVAEVHQWPKRQALGRGKLERRRGDSVGQCPMNRWGLAGVARILPVNVPAGFELEVKAGVVRFAAAEFLVRHYKPHVQMQGVG